MLACHPCRLPNLACCEDSCCELGMGRHRGPQGQQTQPVHAAEVVIRGLGQDVHAAPVKPARATCDCLVPSLPFIPPLPISAALIGPSAPLLPRAHQNYQKDMPCAIKKATASHINRGEIHACHRGGTRVHKGARVHVHRAVSPGRMLTIPRNSLLSPSPLLGP